MKHGKQAFGGVVGSLSLALWASLGVAAAVPDGGIAMRAEPKYKPGFKAFAYANPAAPKGGTLTIGMEGAADTVNPYAIKGEPSLEIQNLVFQELGESALDEPFSRYPGLAESFDIAPDQLSLVVKLREAAKFSDGRPVTADDVVFSYQTFQSAKVPPFYKSYWADIKAVSAVDARTVKFTFTKVNPELPLIATELPVLPKQVYAAGEFDTQAVGSGPYRVKEFKPGSSITLERNPNWWGEGLPVYQGQFNVDTVMVKYFKDPIALGEAFKKGDFDIYDVRISKVWVKDLVGDKFDHLHYIRKELLPNQNAQGGQGFVFNLRNPLFQDRRVRQALALAFDFPWSNANLFYGQYRPNESFFQNTPLAASGLPTAEELAVLTPLKADLPPEVFTRPMGWLGKDLPIKDRLRQAMALLKDAGYSVKDGVAEGPAGRLAFKFLIEPGAMQRVIEPYTQNLRKLGVQVSIEEKESSIFIKRLESREFEMTLANFGESQSPGNEQRSYWGSAAAGENYSQNYSGLKNKAVDALIDKIVYAKSRDELVLYTRCLDRALYHEHLMVQNWNTPSFRVAYWDRFAHPETLPSFYSVRQFYNLLWLDKAKGDRLTKAQADGVALP